MRVEDGMTKWITGWKSIAAYLGASVRTVVAWADTQGLPVVRRGKGGLVRADARKLDGWMAMEENGGVRMDTPEG